MDFIDHGEWVACEKPENYPVKLPPNILFAKRVSDGVDWYQFQRKELTATDSVKLTALKTPDGDWVVLTTTTDASFLFPAGFRLIEVRGDVGDHEKLRMMFLDFEGRRFSPPPPPPATMLQMLMEEIGVDEAKMKAKLEARVQNRSRHG